MDTLAAEIKALEKALKSTKDSRIKEELEREIKILRDRQRKIFSGIDYEGKLNKNGK